LVFEVVSASLFCCEPPEGAVALQKGSDENPLPEEPPLQEGLNLGTSRPNIGHISHCHPDGAFDP
ncbi:DNA-directed RNA polymerase subunit beta', partial [Dissostichus eleginoides]